MKTKCYVSALVFWLALLMGSSASAQDPAMSVSNAAKSEHQVKFNTVVIDGIKIFYREAGDPSKPTILLLHGFPSSSLMFRELIPLLANDFHLIAPDYPGAGFSDYPSAVKFNPTFANLADLMARFVQTIGLSSFTIYMQDFGGPVGFRIAAKHPEWVNGLVIQNANAYMEGIAPEQAKGILEPKRSETEQLVSRDFTLFMYQTGTRDFGAVDPVGWNVDLWILENKEAKRIQTELLLDYHTNLAEYPNWQAYLRTKKPKTLIAWGKNDKTFLPAGAEAYLRDLPQASLKFYNTGHFALEEDALAISGEIIKNFARK